MAYAESGGVGVCGCGGGTRVHMEPVWGAELSTGVAVEPAWLVLQWL